MIIIIGQYRAAVEYAAQHGLGGHQWAPAYDATSACRALMGRDPDSTIIEHVHGFEQVITPEVRGLINLLTAHKSSPPK